MNRKYFLLQSATASAAVLLNPLQSIAKTSEGENPYKLEVVKEFVIAGHSKLDKVKELLEEFPNLLFCRYDWGNGDFEELLKAQGM